MLFPAIGYALAIGAFSLAALKQSKGRAHAELEQHGDDVAGAAVDVPGAQDGAVQGLRGADRGAEPVSADPLNRTQLPCGVL
jgi:hypothetical protein